MNWKYKINIKDEFENNTTPELIIKLCSSLEKQINKILESSQKSNISEESVDDFWYDLEEVKGHFEFLLSLADGSIKEDEWEEYNFDGDYEEWFNDYLNQLYDVADTKITLKSGVKEKLIWIS